MQATVWINAMAEGNPGAMFVLSAGFKEFGDGFILMVKMLPMRGSAIWVMYKDKCGEDLNVMQTELQRITGTSPLEFDEQKENDCA